MSFNDVRPHPPQGRRHRRNRPDLVFRSIPALPTTARDASPAGTVAPASFNGRIPHSGEIAQRVPPLAFHAGAQRSAMRALSVVLLMVMVSAGVAAAPKFRSVWKAPELSGLSFAGKTVAALVITDDQSLQVSAEEKLARELTARGVNALATYRIVPREELRSAEQAR